MRRIPSIRKFMTPFPHWVEIDDPVARVREMMNEHDIRHVPVMDSGRLTGVVSDREVELALDPRLNRPSGDTPVVREICASEVYIVESTQPLDSVLMHMARNAIDAAVVVKDDRLAGIFTMTDAAHVLGNLLRTLFPPGGDDAA